MREVFGATMLGSLTLVTTRVWGEVIQSFVGSALRRACCTGLPEAERATCVLRQDVRSNAILAMGLTLMLGGISSWLR